jgi:hypothetical protein
VTSHRHAVDDRDPDHAEHADADPLRRQMQQVGTGGETRDQDDVADEIDSEKT